MKNARYIILAIAVAIVLVVGVTTTDRTAVVRLPAQEAKEFCYIYNNEAGDSVSLKVAIKDDGVNISGDLSIIPAQKDKKTGTFVGTVTPIDPDSITRTATLMWEASAEGVTNTEELSIIFGQSVASVGFGEMKDRGDGVYVYANREAISYSLNLQQTDCSDSALQ
jgi:hypothetical protein